MLCCARAQVASVAEASSDDANTNSGLVDSLRKGYSFYQTRILADHRQMCLTNKDGLLAVAVLIATAAY